MPRPADRAAKIELLLLDVDGVLTDGGIVYTDAGEELKRFNVRDGSAFKLWHLAGKRSAIVSGRKSRAVERRAAELGVSLVLQGVPDKLPALGVVLT
jgi:3-deoxy-D-manno-octulosonate 8-phosphate phosphatase (KDO 8-P phosphatase)